MKDTLIWYAGWTVCIVSGWAVAIYLALWLWLKAIDLAVVAFKVHRELVAFIWERARLRKR